MKTIFFLTLLIYTSNNILAQFSTNSPFFYYKESKNVLEKNYYTVINDTFDTDSSGCGNHFSLSPLVYSTPQYDVKRNNYFYQYRLGIASVLKMANKLDLNFSYAYGFYRNPLYMGFTDTTGVIPQIGFLSKSKGNNYNFSDIRLNFKYKIKFMTFGLGRDKVFLGDGYRSLWLSDFSSAYPYFSAIVDVWRIKYIYRISLLKDKYPKYSDVFLRKYNFTHLLDFNFADFLHFYMFETVISGAYDENGLRKGIELAYLNPVIFFRAVDLSLGSPDNVLMGLGGHLKYKSSMLYGQAFIDEFLFSHFIARTGYWDNKFGLQVGLKSYKTLGIKGIYSQIEINLVRPYTYSHSDIYLAYGNEYQPLAHPLGANFKEGIAILAYYNEKFYLQAKAVYSISGIDDTLNYGKNIYRSYLSHYSETGNFIGQGIPAVLKYFKISSGYLIYGIGLEAGITYRNFYFRNSINSSFLFSLSLRMNFWDVFYDDWY